MKKNITLTIIITSLLLLSCTSGESKRSGMESVVLDPNNAPGFDTTPEETKEISSEETEKMKTILPTDTPTAITPGGVYLPYTPTAVAQAQGKIILFFHAPWCPTCIESDKNITNSKTIPNNITLLKTSFDDETELREIYSVTTQHTFVQIDHTGKLIKKWRGGTTLEDILSQVQ